MFLFLFTLYKINEEINFLYSIIEFNKNLIDIVKKILKNSYEKIKDISEEPFGPFDEETIYSEIYSYVNKCSYDGNEPESIFEFVGHMFYKYLLGHKMRNGNKRLSLLFLINLLRYFGYHFYWSEGEFKNFKNHKVTIENWIERLSNKDASDFNCKINELIEWIKSNCVLAIQFR